MEFLYPLCWDTTFSTKECFESDKKTGLKRIFSVCHYKVILYCSVHYSLSSAVLLQLVLKWRSWLLLATWIGYLTSQFMTLFQQQNQQDTGGRSTEWEKLNLFRSQSPSMSNPLVLTVSVLQERESFCVVPLSVPSPALLHLLTLLLFLSLSLFLFCSPSPLSITGGNNSLLLLYFDTALSLASFL